VRRSRSGGYGTSPFGLTRPNFSRYHARQKLNPNHGADRHGSETESSTCEAHCEEGEGGQGEGSAAKGCAVAEDRVREVQHSGPGIAAFAERMLAPGVPDAERAVAAGNLLMLLLRSYPSTPPEAYLALGVLLGCAVGRAKP
jgi:hypothetical protein